MSVSAPTAAAFSRAVKADRLQFLRRVKHIELVDDQDQWNAHYDFDRDAIVFQRKFEDKPVEERTQIILHEAGHRGQVLEPETYKAFVEAGLDAEPNFVAMANCVHLKDWLKNGIAEENRSQEAFAESYSRYCLGREMPEEIRKFWQSRGGDA